MNLRNLNHSIDKEQQTMIANYKSAIDLVSTEQNWKAIVLSIAKDHPDVLLSVVNGPIDNNSSLSDVNLQPIVIDTHGGKKIQAIKQLRALTGFGLKHSKDIIDEIQDINGSTVDLRILINTRMGLEGKA
jgi:ribosomal protein L7/L12